jgi:hypothetical protein
MRRREIIIGVSRGTTPASSSKEILPCSSLTTGTELECLFAFAIERVEQIDAAIREAHHRVIGARPEVSIAFSADAARQR